MASKYVYERWRAEALDHLKAARQIADRATASGRDTLTADEQETVKHHLDRANQLGPQVKALGEQLANEDALRGQLGALEQHLYGPPAGSPAGPVALPSKALPGPAWGDEVVRAASGGGFGFKALAPSGTAVVSVPLRPEVVTLGTPTQYLRSLIPAERNDAGRWSFFRQTARTNNAAAVEAGAKKPTSLFTLERIDERVRTVAHLSEPLNRADLADAPDLSSFVDGELRTGLETKIEDLILNGTGDGEEWEGLAAVSGTHAVAYATSPLVSSRKALTVLQTFGYTPTAWVLAPADWESIELSATSVGDLHLAGAGQPVPVESAARRLWGLPVVVSVAATAGFGWLGDFAGSARLEIREDATVDWSEALYSANRFGTGNGGTLFEANQVVFRCECRIGLEISRPAAFAKVDLAA